MEKLKIDLPILVEGKYDKITLSSIVDGNIIPLSGFGIFNSKEKQALVRRLAERGGVILLTDSDAGGKQIRSFISSILSKDKLFHAYIPKIEGKERRKNAPSKEGLLGVEGMGGDTLRSVLSPFAALNAGKRTGGVTKTDMYLDGLSGTDGSKERRSEFLGLAGLPSDMTPNAMLDAINMLFTKEEYSAIVSKIRDDGADK